MQSHAKRHRTQFLQHEHSSTASQHLQNQNELVNDNTELQARKTQPELQQPGLRTGPGQVQAQVQTHGREKKGKFTDSHTIKPPLVSRTTHASQNSKGVPNSYHSGVEDHSLHGQKESSDFPLVQQQTDSLPRVRIAVVKKDKINNKKNKGKNSNDLERSEELQQRTKRGSSQRKFKRKSCKRNVLPKATTNKKYTKRKIKMYSVYTSKDSKKSINSKSNRDIAGNKGLQRQQRKRKSNNKRSACKIHTPYDDYYRAACQALQIAEQTAISSSSNTLHHVVPQNHRAISEDTRDIFARPPMQRTRPTKSAPAARRDHSCSQLRASKLDPKSKSHQNMPKIHMASTKFLKSSYANDGEIS